MRGAQRIRVVALLVLAGVVTGGGLFAVLAVAWGAAGLPRASGAVALAVTVVAVLADVVALRAGRPRPWSVGRQVPQLWGRVFGAETVAVLYGARLGVGPLTILTSWLWWAALALAITLGPVAALAIGAAFHAARVVTMLVTTAGAQSCMSTRLASVQRRERRVATVTAAGALVVVLALVAAACSSSDDRPAAKASAAPTTAAAPSTSTTTTTNPESPAMEHLLLDDALPGFTPAPDERFGAGPLDLEAASRAERDVDAERSVLRTRGFVTGYARVWTGPDDDTVYVAAYRFRTAAGAAAYLEDGKELLLARRVRTFPVEPPPAGGFGFTQVDETSKGAFVGHAVAFVVGDRYFLVIVGGDGSRRTPDEARDVARRQAERVTAASPPPPGVPPPAAGASG